ncbi:hypothetical protein LWI29_024886 [Acer saccharum]|uniref:Uncharacterized protein n=1 Tax=Acer saccharum TaxID=4024 RepID=A0AA39VL06_ACESA|nr:hypothetical protein LWI29_024886 [Acer saccharum]
MIQPVTTEDDIPIHSFEANGSPIYTDKICGHFIWDVDLNMCDADCICRRCLKDTSPRSCKSWPKPHKPGHRDSPWIGLHPIKKKPLPIYDRALQILRSEGLLPPQPDYATPTLPPPVPCYMTSDYDCDFPPLEPSSNQEKTRFSKHFVQSTEVQPDGSFKQPSQAEQKRSPSKQKDKQAASSSYNPVLLASKVSSSSSKSDSTSEDDSSQSSQTSCHSSWLDTANSSPHDHADLTQVYMASRTYPQPSTQTYESPDETTSSAPAPFVEEPPDYVPGRLPAKPTNGPWFTLDDISPGSWRTRVSEMSAWLDLQLAKSEQNLESILREFVSRFTGSLRDWYQALGEYRQLQFVRVPLASQAMGYIFKEFLGDPDHIYKQARQEFFDMRCCSLKRKDIMFHYKRMSQRYHTLGGINDHSLKQVYVNSLPDDLQDEIQRKIDTSGRSLNDTSLGELHMYALSSLDKLCATQRFFSKMLTVGKNLNLLFRLSANPPLAPAERKRRFISNASKTRKVAQKDSSSSERKQSEVGINPNIATFVANLDIMQRNVPTKRQSSPD